MVVVNTIRGLTHSFDLALPADLAALQALLTENLVTAISLLRDGTLHTLTSPRGWRSPVFGARLVTNGHGPAVIGEQVFVQAGDARLTLTWTYSGNVVRTDLTRTGQMRYNASRR